MKSCILNLKSYKRNEDYIYHFAHYMFAARCKAEGVNQFTKFLHLVASTDWSSCAPDPPLPSEWIAVSVIPCQLASPLQGNWACALHSSVRSTISPLQPPHNNTEISSPPVKASHCYGWMRRAAILCPGFPSLSHFTTLTELHISSHLHFTNVSFGLTYLQFLSFYFTSHH